MKLSKYNHIIEKDGYSYWYNGIANKYFRLSASTGNKLRDNLQDFEAWEETYPAVYSKLVEGGFVIEDDVDEYQIILDRAKKGHEDKNAFLIIIPTLNCNYACWYCIQDHIPSKMDQSTMRKICRHIDYLIREECITSLHIDWFGGEPLMYFKEVIVPLGEYAKKACKDANIPFSMGATTNGYFLTSDKIQDMMNLNLIRLHISLDGNQENHDKVKVMRNLSSSFEHVLKNINTMLHSNPDIRLTLRINYTHGNIDTSIVDQVNKWLSSDIRTQVMVNMRKVWQESVDKDFADPMIEILTMFEKSGYEVEYWSPITWGVPCYVSRHLHSTINYQGNVLKCTASDDLYSGIAKGVIGDTGKIEWNKDFVEMYTADTFDTPRCRRCKYLPVCYGQCPRNWIQNSDGCKMEGDDADIEALIVSYINQQYNQLKN